MTPCHLSRRLYHFLCIILIYLVHLRCGVFFLYAECSNLNTLILVFCFPVNLLKKFKEGENITSFRVRIFINWFLEFKWFCLYLIAYTSFLHIFQTVRYLLKTISNLIDILSSLCLLNMFFLIKHKNKLMPSTFGYAATYA